MTVRDFIRTLYVGDRACKAIAVNGWNATVRIQVDCISRVRDPSGSWNYYTNEDVADGVLVFENVQRFELKNGGCIPNDTINSIEVIEQDEDQAVVEISIDSVAPDATRTETCVRFTCGSMHIEDPTRPGVEIL